MGRSPDRPTAPTEGLTDFAGSVRPSVARVGRSGDQPTTKGNVAIVAVRSEAVNSQTQRIAARYSQRFEATLLDLRARSRREVGRRAESRKKSSLIEYKSTPMLFQLLVAPAVAAAEVLLRRKHLAALVGAANRDGDLALVGFGWRGPFFCSCTARGSRARPSSKKPGSFSRQRHHDFGDLNPICTANSPSLRTVRAYP